MGCAVTRDGQWGALSLEMGNGVRCHKRWAMGCAVTRDGQWGALSLEMGNGVRCH